MLDHILRRENPHLDNDYVIVVCQKHTFTTVCLIRVSCGILPFMEPTLWLLPCFFLVFFEDYDCRRTHAIHSKPTRWRHKSA